jgi:plasmid stability protein
MAQLFITDLDDAAKERLMARARRHGRDPEAEGRAIIEEAVGAEPLEQGPGLKEEGTPLLGSDEKGFGDLMYERFKDIGLNEEEFRRFSAGIAEINSMWEMSLPDFEADEYEETPSKK